jgi:hypothetical protein
MATVLEKKQAAKDKAGRKLAAKGLREYRVTLITPAAIDPAVAEAYARLGKKPPAAGEPTRTVLDPAPEVGKASLHRVAQSGGMVLAGDIRIKAISRDAKYEAQVKNPLTVWLVEGPDVNGEFSTIDGQLDRHDAEWRATLKKKGDTRPRP